MIRWTSLPFLVLGQTILAGAAVSGPIDCEKLKDSSTPYQTTNVTQTDTFQGVQTKQSTLQYQRNADGYSVVLTASDAQATTKAFFRYGILLSSHTAAGGKDLRIKTTIDGGPTDVYAAAKNFTYRETSAVGDTPAKVYDVVGTYAGREDVTIGPCVFSVHRYDVKKTLLDDDKPTATIVDATLEYSPELRTILASKIASTTPKFVIEATTKTITTDFTPMADPGD